MDAAPEAPSAPKQGGAVGLIYVVLLLVILGGGGVAVWLLWKHANPPPSPTPAPAPAPTAHLDTFSVCQGDKGCWVDNRSGPSETGVFVDLASPSPSYTISPGMSIDDCKAACKGRPTVLFKPSWNGLDWTFDGSVAAPPAPFPFPVNATPSVQALSHVDLKPNDTGSTCQCTTVAIPAGSLPDGQPAGSPGHDKYPWTESAYWCTDKMSALKPNYEVATNYDELLAKSGGLNCFPSNNKRH